MDECDWEVDEHEGCEVTAKGVNSVMNLRALGRLKWIDDCLDCYEATWNYVDIKYIDLWISHFSFFIQT